MLKNILQKHARLLLTLAVLAAIVLGVVIYQVITVQKAHSSFERYYAFRGCTQLLERTDTYGRCKLKDGSEIKIVQYQGRWFLDGDLPGIW